MSNLNWPEGATHYLRTGDEHTRFRDLSGEKWKFFNALTGQWSQHYFSSEELLQRVDLIPRPQPKPWSGPEDGLPPTGTVCEHKRVHEWQQIEVFAVKPNYNGSNTALFTYGNGCWGGCAEPSFFRAIPSPAQLRETAIRELMDIAGVDCRVTAARLVDAGFKREVV